MAQDLLSSGSAFSEFRSAARRRRLRVALGLATALTLISGTLACLVTQPMPFVKSGSGPCPVEPVRLEAHVRYLSEACFPRDWRSTENLDKAAAYISAALAEAGGRVTEQRYEVRGKGYLNIVGSFGPEVGPRVVVGAHYDACEALPAADDNASGVAALLELGRRLGKEPSEGRVDLVAFSLEEPPFFRTPHMGSAQHAASLEAAGAEVRAMVSLEMIGHFEDAAGSQRYPSALLGALYPDRGDFIAVVGRLGDLRLVRAVKGALRRATPLPVVSINAPRWIPGVDFSDHHPYWDRGFPAVMVTDTAFNRNLDYHTERDTPGRLDYVRMARVVQGVEAAVRELGR